MPQFMLSTHSNTAADNMVRYEQIEHQKEGL